jgi:hypothetical protein
MLALAEIRPFFRLFAAFLPIWAAGTGMARKLQAFALSQFATGNWG